MLLAACAPHPVERSGGDFDAIGEKSMFLALKEVKANDDQRLAVMAAYDESHPRLEALAEESGRVLQRWHELDRQDPAFRDQASALADRSGEIARERMALSAKFEARVAGALSAEQWRAWQQYWVRPGFGPGEGERGGHEGRRGRRLTP